MYEGTLLRPISSHCVAFNLYRRFMKRWVYFEDADLPRFTTILECKSASSSVTNRRPFFLHRFTLKNIPRFKMNLAKESTQRMLLMGRSKVPSYTEFLPKEGDPTGVECINCGWSTCAKKGNKQCDHIGLDCLEASPSKREECVRWRVNRPSQDKKSSCNGRAQVAMEGIQKERELKRGAEKEVRLAELHHQELTEQRTAENEVQVQRVELELKHQEKMRRIEGQERTRLAEIDANTFTTQMGAVLTNQAKAEQEQTTRNACTTAALVAASSSRESADTKCKQQATPAAARKLQLYAWLEEQ